MRGRKKKIKIRTIERTQGDIISKSTNYIDNFPQERTLSSINWTEEEETTFKNSLVTKKKKKVVRPGGPQVSYFEGVEKGMQIVV